MSGVSKWLFICENPCPERAEPAGKGKHSVTSMNPLAKSRLKPPFVSGVTFTHKVRGADDPKAQPGVAMPSDFQTGAARAFQWGEELYGKVCDYACLS